MKKITLLTAILACIYSSNYGQKQSLSFPKQAKVKTIMDEAMKTSDLPAVVAIAINSKHQKVTYTYGKAVWTENASVSTKNIFRIYSMTKLVTSIAAMQLVEKGLIKLDDDLSLQLPEMAKIPILSNGQLMPATKPITLRHLLTHTSGFGYNGTDKELSAFDRSKWEYKDLPRRFESGTAFLYDTSTDWTGRLIEKVSGMNLEKYFRKNITAPLGMNRTWFNVPDSLKQFIVSYGNRGDDGNQPLKESPDRIPTTMTREFSGGGGLFSSPEDYTKLLRCMLNYGTSGKLKILKKETILEMNKNQIGDISMEHAGDYFGAGSCCNFHKGNLTSKNTKWGLAWLIDNEDKPSGRKAGTVLWGGLMNTYFYIDYKSGIAASIYSQHLPFNHAETTTLFDKFSEIIYSKK